MIRSSFLLSFLLLPLFIFAQRGDGNRATAAERADRMTQTMTDSLNLTEAQIALVREANLTYLKSGEELRQQMRAQRESGNMDRTAFRTQRENLDKDHLKALKPILDTDQYKRYWQMREAQRAQRQERGREMRQRTGERRRGRGNQNPDGNG